MTFSVVTPSFRGGAWLRLCIASVADQGLPVEHIVQDGGSDDGTLDWLNNDPRVRLLVERDQGMYDAINRGLRRAGGDILAHLNCDEQYLPGTLEAVTRLFASQTDLDVVFADAVVVDPEGNYLWHRKSLVPLPWHTRLFPLSTLTCATFFRRRVLDALECWFDPRWRYCGDSAWVVRLLERKARMSVLRRFTSVFTHTGQNLSLNSRARAEAQAFFAQAPRLARLAKPLVLAHHRWRRLRGGVYHQAPFRFSLYTRDHPEERVERVVDQPTFRWRW